jgi:hypothetical protein
LAKRKEEWFGKVLSSLGNPTLSHIVHRYVWSNGDVYEGEFFEGRREGRGVMICTNGDRYEGEWREGQMNGWGKAIKAKYVYEGDFLDGEKDGMGIITFENGVKYEGGFKDGNKNGFGRDIMPDGTKWEGEYISGKKKEEIIIPKDQAINCDWRDVPEDEQRLKDRKERRKKLYATSSQTGRKKRRKKPPFITPEKT